VKVTQKEKAEQKSETKTSEIEGLENLYAFKAGASCGLYSMGEEFWENLGEKIPMRKIERK